VRGLTLGDDHVTKPFSLEEVMARVQALLRRAGGRGRASAKLTLADLELDDDAHVVRRGDEVIDLSPTEYNLLRFMLANAGRVMSRAQILDHVWEYDFGAAMTRLWRPTSATCATHTAFDSRIDVVERHIERGERAQATAQLAALRSRPDGCDDVGGDVDTNDWIRVCEAQLMIRPIIDGALADLG
jgi:hypothetical protein